MSNQPISNVGAPMAQPTPIWQDTTGQIAGAALTFTRHVPEFFSDGRITIQYDITDNITKNKNVFTHTFKVKLGCEQIETQARAKKIAAVAKDIIDKAFDIDVEYAKECFGHTPPTAITRPPPYWINISFPENGSPVITQVSRKTLEKERTIVISAFAKQDLEKVKQEAQKYFDCRNQLRTMLPAESAAVKLEALKRLAREPTFEGIYRTGAESALDAFGDELERLEKAVPQAQQRVSPDKKQKAIKEYQKKVQDTVLKALGGKFPPPPAPNQLTLQQVTQHWHELQGGALPDVPVDVHQAKQFQEELLILQEKLARPSSLWREPDIDEPKRKTLLATLEQKLREIANVLAALRQASPIRQPPPLSPFIAQPARVVQTPLISPQSQQATPATPLPRQTPATFQAATPTLSPATVPSDEAIPPPPEIPPDKLTAVTEFKTKYQSIQPGALADPSNPKRQEFDIALQGLKTTLGDDWDGVKDELNEFCKPLLQPAPTVAAQRLQAISLAPAAPVQPSAISVEDIPEGTGITNAGNTCYLDAPLQALRNCKRFREIVNAPPLNIDENACKDAAKTISERQKFLNSYDTYVDVKDNTSDALAYKKYVEKKQKIAEESDKKIQEEQTAYNILVQESDQEYEKCWPEIRKDIAKNQPENVNKPTFYPVRLVAPAAKKAYDTLVARQKWQAEIDESYVKAVEDLRVKCEKDIKVWDNDQDNTALLGRIRGRRDALRQRDKTQIEQCRKDITTARGVLAKKLTTHLFQYVQFVENPNNKASPLPAQLTKSIRDDLLEAGYEFPSGGEHDATEVFTAISQLLGFEEVKKAIQESFSDKQREISIRRAKEYGPCIHYPITEGLGNLQEFFNSRDAQIDLTDQNITYLKKNQGVQDVVPNAQNAYKGKNQVFIEGDAPKLLYISLDRFTESKMKDARKVEIPQTLSISGQTYRLKSAVLHVGGQTVEYGHYINLCPRWKADGTIEAWINYNDKAVTKINLNDHSRWDPGPKETDPQRLGKTYKELLDQNAYGLYYEPTSEPANPAPPPQPALQATPQLLQGVPAQLPTLGQPKPDAEQAQGDTLVVEQDEDMETPPDRARASSISTPSTKPTHDIAMNNKGKTRKRRDTE